MRSWSNGQGADLLSPLMWVRFPPSAPKTKSKGATTNATCRCGAPSSRAKALGHLAYHLKIWSVNWPKAPTTSHLCGCWGYLSLCDDLQKGSPTCKPMKNPVRCDRRSSPRLLVLGKQSSCRRVSPTQMSSSERVPL